VSNSIHGVYREKCILDASLLKTLRKIRMILGMLLRAGPKIIKLTKNGVPQVEVRKLTTNLDQAGILA